MYKQYQKKETPMKKYFLLLALCTYSLLSFGQLKESQEIDSLFIKWDQQNVPGGAIGIIKDGKLIYAKRIWHC